MHNNPVNDYIKKYVVIICDEFFKKKKLIHTEEIVSITPVRQINCLVFQSIYQNWKIQFDRKEDIYFDYQHPDVVLGMFEFMSLISKHIRIYRIHFEKLLFNATLQTLQLLFSPKEYYIHLFKGLEKGLDLSGHFSSLMRYVILHVDYKRNLIKLLKDYNIHFVPFATAINICKDFNFEGRFDNPRRYIDLFNKTFLLDSETLFPSWESNLKLKKKKINFSEELEEEMRHTMEFDKEQKNRAELFNTSEEEINQFSEKISVKSNSKKPIQSSLYPMGINSVHQWEILRKSLFKDDEQAIQKAFNEISQSNSYHTAIQLIKDKYIPLYKWNILSESTADFLKIIENYFE